jgi:hypothetical protein
MIIKHLENKNQSYKNIKFNGLQVKCLLNGLANSGSQQVDFSKSSIQVILTRDGRPHVIMQQNLKILGLASTLLTLNQSSFATTVSIGQQLVAGQTGMVNFNIPLGGVIDLKNDDEIYIEVQNSAGLFLNPVLEPASYLEIKPIKCYGIEKFIPRILTKVIQAGESSNQYMLGDNLIRLAILNFDKTDFQNNVLQNVVFSSDRLDDAYTYQDLIANKISSFGVQLMPGSANDLSAVMQEDQSFLITDFHHEYDNVTLDIQFNAGNVTASNNYIVAWNYDTDWTIINAAQKKEAQYAASTAKKLDVATLKK